MLQLLAAGESPLDAPLSFKVAKPGKMHCYLQGLPTPLFGTPDLRALNFMKSSYYTHLCLPAKGKASGFSGLFPASVYHKLLTGTSPLLSERQTRGLARAARSVRPSLLPLPLEGEASLAARNGHVTEFWAVKSGVASAERFWEMFCPPDRNNRALASFFPSSYLE